MKRKFVVICLLTLSSFYLLSDIVLLIRLDTRPEAFASVAGFSPVHRWVLVDGVRVLALMKVGFTLAVIGAWLLTLLRPQTTRLALWLNNLYALWLLSLGVLVYSSVIGTLQQVAGRPFSPFSASTWDILQLPNMYVLPLLVIAGPSLHWGLGLYAQWQTRHSPRLVSPQRADELAL